MLKIAHLVNPVKVTPSSDLFVAQPITFETMIAAQHQSEGVAEVKLFVTGFEEDTSIFPARFDQLELLERSILDLAAFEKKKRLPLIADLLERLSGVEADIFVYSNVDIAVQPYFYTFIAERFNAGTDAMIINRRIVEPTESNSLESYYEQVGKKHPGYDCFVFQKQALKDYYLGEICIGANWIGNAMYVNLVASSNRLEILKESHLTFHVGEDGDWLKGGMKPYGLHNKMELEKILAHWQSRDLSSGKAQAIKDVEQMLQNWYASREDSKLKSAIKKIIR